jgi:cytochrome c-type biogenesis protein CcmH/NrfF
MSNASRQKVELRLRNCLKTLDSTVLRVRNYILAAVPLNAKHYLLWLNPVFCLFATQTLEPLIPV